MKLAEISQSPWGRAGIALAIFGAGYYFPLFRPASSLKPAAAQGSAPAAAISRDASSVQK